MIVIVCGLPGSGKTYFATVLAEEVNAAHISSDAIRMDLLKNRSYSDGEREFVYLSMLEALKNEVNNGGEGILDATFSSEKYRKFFIDFSSQRKIPLKIIEVVANEEDIIERTNRKRQGTEADYNVYLKLKSEFDPIDEDHLILNSSELPLEEMLYRSKIYLSK